MDITWYGQNCFKISERGRLSIVTDPFSEALGLLVPKNLKGELVTLSNNHPDYANIEAVKGYQHVLAGSGEYEIGGVFVSGVALHNHDPIIHNVGYVIKYDDISVAHLGNLAYVPDQSTLEAIGEVHIVLVPVGGGNALKAGAAAEVIALLEPSYIVPMHYSLAGLNHDLDPVEKFLKEMGVSKVQEEDVLRVTTTMPEQPQVIVLRPQA
ncbi:MAG: MBL fold metallo-hydrolase [Phototrophicales bacterium]|nr:MBL fold metallo-hydrolase [Phototrophicales bacterium]